MDSAREDSAERARDDWWAEAFRTSFQPSTPTPEQYDLIPAGFTREYHVLAEVCASMSSGFLLLNQRLSDQGGPKEQIIYSNPSALRLLGIGKGALVSPHEFDVREHLLTVAVDPSQARSELDRLWYGTGYPEEEYAADLALADAAVRWLRVRSFPVRSDQGHMLGRGVLLDDITLERSTLESRAETLALAAHELKTPLAIIKGCATTLLGSAARWDPAMQREMLQMIDTQSDRLHDVLNTLLDVWRLDAGTLLLRLNQTRLPVLISQLINRWQQHASSHRFLIQMPEDLPMVVCDVVRIEQALNHLLNNAVTYSSSGTTITILLETNAYELRVAISDEGIGVEAEHLHRIFDRFYRIQQDESDAEGKVGSGLGLAAARSAIEAHGGKIWADSPGRNQGATFSFTLPLTAHIAPSTQGAMLASQVSTALPTHTASARQTTVAHPALYRQDRRIHVLLAENDPRLARYLRANLEEQQYRVHTVSHGIQFLKQLDLEEPDVILLSTRLADMHGVELLQRLREFSQTPVIMLCDDCDEDERVQLFDLGSDDLVMKPFGMKELLARVRALLRRQAPPAEQGNAQSVFTTGELTIDHAQHLVTVAGNPVQLSRTEYRLLSVLAHNVGIVVTHEILLEKVWGPEYNRDVDFIWVYISRLRRKIEADSRRPKYILTVPDVGYKLAKL